jgi:hypothetical protein
MLKGFKDFLIRGKLADPGVLAAVLLAAAAVPLIGQQSTGYVKTSVSPGRAGVFIDGKYVGPAANFRFARKYAVAPGEHEIRLVDPRFEELVTKVQVEPGKTARVRETLKPLPSAKPPFGRLRVSHPDKFAAVYINEKYFGHVDEFSNFAQGVLLNPGEYEVRIEPVAGGQAVVRKVSIKADQITLVSGAEKP